MPTTYISNSAHYTMVLARVAAVRRSLWIGTADIKDLYVKSTFRSWYKRCIFAPSKNLKKV